MQKPKPIDMSSGSLESSSLYASLALKYLAEAVAFSRLAYMPLIFREEYPEHPRVMLRCRAKGFNW